MVWKSSDLNHLDLFIFHNFKLIRKMMFPSPGKHLFFFFFLITIQSERFQPGRQVARRQSVEISPAGPSASVGEMKCEFLLCSA